MRKKIRKHKINKIPTPTITIFEFYLDIKDLLQKEFKNLKKKKNYMEKDSLMVMFFYNQEKISLTCIKKIHVIW